MRIDEIAIDGFGRFHEVRYHPAPGLTVIRGDNEAGKSTLLSFIRSILFGFETDRHPALAGGTRGGWLRVTTSDGVEYRIERYSARGGAGRLAVRDPSGADRGAALLPRILQGVEATVYRNVFAFGLEELSELKRLTDGEVASRIYGAGLGTGAASALEVEDELRAEQRRIFLPSGEIPRLNALLRQVDEVDQRLGARDLPAEYGAQQRRLAEIEAEVAGMETLIAETAAGRLDDERLVRGWPAWLAMRAAMAELGTLDDPGSLPPDALATYRQLSSGVEAAEREHTELRRRVEVLDERLQRVSVDARLLERRAEIATALDDAAAMRSRAAERDRLEGEIVRARALADAAIERLGAGWDRGRVAGFDDSITVRTAIGRFRTSLNAVDAEVGRAEEELRIAERELAEAQRRVHALAEVTGAPGDGEPDLAARGEPRAGDLLEERERRLRALDEALVTVSALASLAPSGDAYRPRRESRIPAPATLTAAAAALIGLASAAALWSAGLALFALAAAAGGIATLAGTLVWWRRRRDGVPVSDEPVSEQHAARIAAARRAVSEHATALGLPADPGPDEVARLRAEVISERAERHAESSRRADLARQLAVEERQRHVLAERLAIAERRVADGRARASGTRDDWRAWLTSSGLPSDADPEAAALIVEAVGSAKARVDAVSDAEARLGGIETEDERSAERARILLESLERPPSHDESLGPAIERLGNDLDATLAADAERAATRRDLEELCPSKAAARERQTVAAERLAAHLAACGVADEAELVRRAELAEHRDRLSAAIATQRTALTTLSGPGEALDRFTATLTAVEDIADVERRLAERSARLAELTDRRDAALEEVGQLKASIRAMEESVEATEDRQLRSDLIGQLSAEAERWTVLALAIGVLRHTRERYERQHRPAVLCSAERYLDEWTAGRYVRIVAPTGQQIQALERRDGVHVPLTGLSRGTAEQLYLALRFGLVEHFATEAEPLPIVMDEILVNFDDGRARAAARSIEDLASRHQILYFTCRDDGLLAADVELRLEPASVATVAQPSAGEPSAGEPSVAVGPGDRPADGGSAERAPEQTEIFA